MTTRTLTTAQHDTALALLDAREAAGSALTADRSPANRAVLTAAAAALAGFLLRCGVPVGSDYVATARTGRVVDHLDAE